MAPRLKVFVTSDGLTDYVVATTSKAKALAARGLHQDDFKEGQAHETDEPALVKAATAQPGEVLRRPAGSRAALAKLKPARPAKPQGPTKAQLKRVSDLPGEATWRAARGRTGSHRTPRKGRLQRRHRPCPRAAVQPRQAGDRRVQLG